MLSEPARTERSIIFADTGETTQTGERIARCRQYVTGDHFMATYGDGVGDIDVAALGRVRARAGQDRRP